VTLFIRLIDDSSNATLYQSYTLYVVNTAVSNHYKQT